MSILYVIAIIGAITAARYVLPFAALWAWNEGARWMRRRAARVTILPALLLLGACNAGGLLVAEDGGTGGDTTTTTTPEACTSAACVPGSYSTCDDNSTPEPCCDNGEVSSQCVLPSGVLVHSPACDSLCGTTAAQMSSCALAGDGGLTCCLGGACAADGGGK